MTTTTESRLNLPQGDVRLLHSETAQRLLVSTELARFAYVAHDGTPRVFPGTRMARIAVRPTWVGVLDSTTRFPGGGTAEQFVERGR